MPEEVELIKRETIPPRVSLSILTKLLKEVSAGPAAGEVTVPPDFNVEDAEAVEKPTLGNLAKAFGITDDDIKAIKGTKTDRSATLPRAKFKKLLGFSIRAIECDGAKNILRAEFEKWHLDVIDFNLGNAETADDVVEKYMAKFAAEAAPNDYPYREVRSVIEKDELPEAAKLPDRFGSFPKYGGRTRPLPAMKVRVDREWLAEEIQDAVMSEGNRLVVVTGGPGTGKSVLAANIESDVAIFCESDGAVATARAALNAVILGLYEEFNFDAPKEKEGVDRTLERDIDDYLVKPWVDDKSFKREVTVVIDGLDEAAGSPELADVLGSCAGSLPTWLRIVVFTRPEAIIADALCRSNRAERICMEDDVEAREAVSKYCADRLGKGSFAAKRAAQIADGLFILARLLCDEYKNNPKFLFDGANGLNELYAVMVSARVKDNPHVATVLGLVSAAPGITAGLLEKCLSWNSYFGGFEPTPRVSLETAKRHLASLLTFGEGDDPVVPFHQSFAEWMAGADSELVTPVEEVDEALAQACSKEFSEARERGEWPCDFVMENVVPFVKSISSDFDASASDMAALIIWNTQRAEAHGVNGDFETELRCRRTVYDLSTRLYCTGEFHDVGYAVPHLADAAYRASCAANAAGKLEECVDFCACGLRFLFESRPNDKISLMKWWATNCDIQALYAFQLTLRQAMTLSRLNRMSECNEAFLEARRFCRLSSNKVALTRTLRQWANCFGKEPDDKSKKYALEKVFEIDEAWGGNLYALKDEDGAEYVMVLVDKATHLLHNGRISDALLLLNEASKLINGDAPEVVLGKNDLSQLHLITSRALRAKESGDGKRLSKALANARIAAALKEEVQGSRSAGAATCRCEVAHCLLAMGRAKQALEIYEDALRIRRAIYGEGSSQVHTAESFVKKARAVIDETERARAEKRARGRK